MSRQMTAVCAIGIYNYGDKSRGYSHEYQVFPCALERLGYEVIVFDLRDRESYGDFLELNRALLETVARVGARLLFCSITHYEVWLETLDIIRNLLGCVIINWATDDSWRYESFSRYVARGVDVMATTYPEAYAKYQKDGFKNAYLTQWGVNANDLREPIRSAYCKYEVTFIGTAHGARKDWVQRLRGKRVPVQCFGYGWENGPLEDAEVRRIIRESLICLNFANSSRVLKWGCIPVRQNQIKARLFEVPGSGGFMLTEWAPHLERFYAIDKEIAVFRDLEECAEKVKFFCANREERDRVAVAGFERTKGEHTYDLRLGALLKYGLTARDERTAALADSNVEGQIRHAFGRIAERHNVTPVMRLIRSSLTAICSAIWGPKRGARAARRISFEICWRLRGAATYGASGWPGRMFFRES